MLLNRRSFLRLGLTLPLAGNLATRAFATSTKPFDALTAQQFDFSVGEAKRLQNLIASGLLEIVPVARAADSDRFQHLGWPVATQLPSGRTIVVFTRKGGHHDDETVDDPEAGRYVIWSDDLVHWSAAGRVGPHDGMHCVGWAPLPDGGSRVILVVSADPRRLYFSDSEGESWTEHSELLSGLLNGATHCGPNLVAHPTFGLLTPFGQQLKGSKNFLVRTRDAGKTWSERVWKNYAPGRSVEPALAVWGPGHMVMVAREFKEDFGRTADGYFAHTQHVYRFEAGAEFDDIQFTTAQTNIIGNAGAGSECHDTAEVTFNPVSRRLETLQSHRWGGGGARTGGEIAEDERDEISSLNLWSIDPDELLAGSATWRFDGTIIERIGYSRKGNKDGLHPGGSVIDLRRGLQHVFVYAGWRRGPSGIYRISRSLDTERWRKDAI